MNARSETRIPTAKASGYLKQLCKLFGHKRPASFDARKGQVEFDAGLCKMEAPEAFGFGI